MWCGGDETDKKIWIFLNDLYIVLELQLFNSTTKFIHCLFFDESIKKNTLDDVTT